MSEPHQDPVLTPVEAAKFINMTPRFLAMRRYKGGGPPHIRISRTRVMYLKSDLVAWIDGLRRESTSDPGPDGDLA